MVARNVARLEMNLRGAQIIARDEAVEYFGEEAPLLRPEPSHDAEIDRDQLAVLVDEQIAGPQYFDRNGAPALRCLDLGAMDLRDGGGRNRWPEGGECLGNWLVEG